MYTRHFPLRFLVRSYINLLMVVTLDVSIMKAPYRFCHPNVHSSLQPHLHIFPYSVVSTRNLQFKHLYMNSILLPFYTVLAYFRALSIFG